jgi:hypothetical protein
METLEKSLDTHRRKSGAHAFLRAVDRQNIIVQGMENTADLSPDLPVSGDLTVDVNLKVDSLRDTELSFGSS